MNLSTALAVAGFALTVWGFMDSRRRAAAAAPAPALLAPGAAALLLGDSIGQGLEAPLRAALLPSGHGLYASVERGRSITAQNAHALPETSNLGVTVALLSLGSNDTNNPDGEEPALRALVAKLQERGLAVYWIVPPAWSQGLPKQEAVTRLFERVGVPTLRVAILPSVDADPSKIHPTADGYREYAGEIAAVLEGATP